MISFVVRSFCSASITVSGLKFRGFPKLLVYNQVENWCFCGKWASANLGIVVSSNYRWNSCPSLLSYDRPDLALIANTSVGFATSGASSITVAGGSSFYLVFLCRILLLEFLWEERFAGPLCGFQILP